MNLHLAPRFLAILCCAFALWSAGASAFDQPPWDTGHETIQIVLGPEDADPGAEL